MWDVVVIGAGLSGLTAAQALSHQGYRVLVVDKSRGVGGRLATRRVLDQPVDHGCRFLQPDLKADWLAKLWDRGILRPWQPQVFEVGEDHRLRPQPSSPSYLVAPQGMTTVAKTLAQGLPLWRQWRVTQIVPQGSGWQVFGVCPGPHPEQIQAKAVVIAIPAPQLGAVLQGAASHNAALQALLTSLQAVRFDSVMTVMAAYGPAANLAPELPPNPASGWMVVGRDHPDLAWAGLDSSKRLAPTEAVVVFHSTPAFAQTHLDAPDLQPVGQQLLTALTPSLGPAIVAPRWMQVHRWRYGLVNQPLGCPVLTHGALPTLVGCGDWCQGADAAAAMQSGQAAAAYLQSSLG
jgi:renalase